MVHDVRQSDGQSNVFDHDVGSLPNGGAYFAWDGYKAVGSYNYLDGATLDGLTETVGSVENISVPGQNALAPDVLSAPNGLASIFWVNNAAGGIWEHTGRDLNGTLSAPADTTPQSADQPAAVVDAVGNVTYFWVDDNASPNALKLQQIPAGGTPGSAMTVYEAEINDGMGDIHADVSSTGVITVAWTRGDNEAGTTSIYAMRIQPDNTSDSPTIVASAPAGTYLEADDVKVGPSGQAAISYVQEDDDENDVQKLALVATNGSVTDVTVPNGGYDVGAIFFDYLPSGTLIYGFTSHFDSSQVRVVTVGSDGTASAPVDLSDSSLPAYYASQIVVDATGVATVAISLSGQPSAVFATRSSNGTDWSTPVQLSEDVDSFSPELDADAQGNVTVAWRTNDNSIFATQWRVGVNDPPACEDGSGASSGGGISVFSLSCVSTAPATYELVSPPENGTVTVDPDTGAVTYSPRAGFNGADTFTFRATNANGDSELRTFTVTVTGNSSADPPAPAPGSPAALKLTDLKISQKLVPRRAVDREKLRLTFTLTRAANVRVTVMRRYGRKLGTACRSTRRLKKSGRLNRCLRDKPAFELKLGALSAGAKSVSIPVKSVRELLNPGAYMLRVSAVAEDGSRAAGNRKFHVNWKSYN